MSRLRRKNEHLFGAARNMPARADFSEISFVHNCLPDCDVDEINLETSYLGRTHRSPLFINALTGGTALSASVNAELALVAKECGLPLAVGSQMAGLEKSSLKARRSFTITRSLNRDGELWANIGSYADPGLARGAVKMIAADALQVHLNVAQELHMPEGDRAFKGALERISLLVKSVLVPVIVKEVGFGIAREEAVKLKASGVAAIDIGGRGGTNFIDLENDRSGNADSYDLTGWGISTALSLIEVSSICQNSGPDIFASGGLHHPLDVAKALALGAQGVGMAGLPLYLLRRRGRQNLIKVIRQLEESIKKIMILTGARTIAELQQVPLVITGSTAEWLERRGINPDEFARRTKDEQ